MIIPKLGIVLRIRACMVRLFLFSSTPSGEKRVDSYRRELCKDKRPDDLDKPLFGGEVDDAGVRVY